MGRKGFFTQWMVKRIEQVNVSKKYILLNPHVLWMKHSSITSHKIKIYLEHFRDHGSSILLFIWVTLLNVCLSLTLFTFIPIHLTCGIVISDDNDDDWGNSLLGGTIVDSTSAV